MEAEKLIERITELRAEESGQPQRQVYMSFCDPERPTGTQFLGALVVTAHGVATAMWEVNSRGLNPGGEVLFVDVPADRRVPESHCNRLLNREEAENLPYETVEG